MSFFVDKIVFLMTKSIAYQEILNWPFPMLHNIICGLVRVGSGRIWLVPEPLVQVGFAITTCNDIGQLSMPNAKLNRKN